MKKQEAIKEFYNDIEGKNSESAKKERFITLLRDLFTDRDSRKIINEFASGAEKSLKIPLKDRMKSGRADTQYRKVIIEFESDLNKTGKHAKDQLIEYIAGFWNQETEDAQIKLVASDLVTWKIYAPIYDHEVGSPFDIDEIELKEVDTFKLDGSPSDDFFYFLDRHLFKTHPLRPTLERIKQDFGESSDTFIKAIQGLTDYFQQAKGDNSIQVSFTQWEKFLSIAYGSFESAEEIFIVHTYLSLLAKFLAYEVLTQDDWIDGDELEGIVKGSIFERENVQNFIDKDFYNWVARKPHLDKLKHVFRLITQKLGDYDFSEVDEDILKGVYQELIDLETRHSLGEYYTPDWLCSQIVEDLQPESDAKILDPACGSGSFLKASIDYLKAEYPDLNASDISNQIVGIDIHPLSVQIAKTTVILALGDRIQTGTPIHLRIYLANTLLIPDKKDAHTLFGGEFNMRIDKKSFYLNTKILDDQYLFDQALYAAEELATISSGDEDFGKEALGNALKQRVGYRGDDRQLDSFYNIYKAFKESIEEGRDSIWRFIVQNTYKPFMLKDSFDYVIGNPPWLTYSDIEVSEYQKDLKELAEKYDVKPDRVTNYTHMEIASIFLSHCSSFFLKKNATVAFVLPRSIFNADHHSNIRYGRAKGYKIRKIWDMEGIKPLFNVPSCVIFANRKKSDINIPKSGRLTYYFEGNLSEHNAKREEADEQITKRKTKLYHAKLGKLDALSYYKVETEQEKNPYSDHFRQGATIVPRNFYFIELLQDEPDDFDDKTIVVQTSEESIKYAKAPWKELTLEGKVNTQFIFRTALARNILPFTSIDLQFVLLPVEIDKDGFPMLKHWKSMIEEGYVSTGEWFQEVERGWENHKTDNNKDVNYLEYLDWQNKLTNQNTNLRYKILYTASGKNANACVVESEGDMKFLADAKSYIYSTKNQQEAYYVTTFLNADYTNELIKSFQSKGLFGVRDVHKKILEVPFPEFDPKNAQHQELSELGMKCEKKASNFASEEEYSSLAPNQLGRARRSLKQELTDEYSEINDLVERVMNEG